MDPVAVILLGFVALDLIGWLWWEWRCAMKGWREAAEQRDRAVSFATSLVESLDLGEQKDIERRIVNGLPLRSIH